MRYDTQTFVDKVTDLSKINHTQTDGKKVKISKLDYHRSPHIADTLVSQQTVLISFLQTLGSPQNQFKTIHISGTSGKGITSTLISRTLTELGITNGLFINPFIYDFREIF